MDKVKKSVGKTIIKDYNSNVFILNETWLNEKIPNYVSGYEIVQTDYSKHQGVAILAKESSVSKI